MKKRFIAFFDFHTDRIFRKKLLGYKLNKIDRFVCGLSLIGFELDIAWTFLKYNFYLKAKIKRLEVKLFG